MAVSSCFLFFFFLIERESAWVSIGDLSNLKNFSFLLYKDSKIYEKDYLLELEIPSINLRELVYDMDSEENDVDYHIEILEDSNFERHVYFFAGHSGNGKNNYFNDLNRVRIGDVIYIRKDDVEYSYFVEEIYFILKSGYLEVESNLSNVLFLITCSLEYSEKQLVVKAKLV